MKINAFERNKGKKIQENYNWQFSRQNVNNDDVTFSLVKWN